MDKYVKYALLLAAGVIIFLLLRKPEPVVMTNQPKETTINKNIHTKEIVKEKQLQVIRADDKIVVQLSKELSRLQEELMKVKNSRDTFQIVNTQDSVINVLYERDSFKDDMLARKDTVIDILEYTVASKDTIISLKDSQIKKGRRRLGASLLLNAALGTFLILK